MPVYSPVKNLINFISSFFNSIKYKLLKDKNPLCRIEAIDLNTKIIIIHCSGISAPIKLTFDEIINDFIMLSNFASKHASWIGYYYGKHYNELLNKRGNYDVFSDFSIDDQSGKFNIL